MMADPDLAPAADTMADPVVAPSGEQSPLGPSASQFDELRDVPAYLRRDDTAERFKGMAADSEVQRALAGEFGQSVQELVASQMQAGDQGKSLYERAQAGELGLDPFAGNKSAQQVAMENQRPALPLKDVIFAGDANAARGMTKEGHFDDKQAGTGPQFRGAERTRWQSGQEGDVLPPESSSTKPAGELPGAVIEGEAREVGTELPHRDVVYGADQRQPDAKPMRGSATESAVGPLQTLRITRKGKPFATEKEAAMASRKGKEMPVPLNGGGFGVAEIAEVEQVQAANNPNAINGQQGNNQPQAEVNNEPVTPVPAISSEGQGDQPGAGEPAAAGAGPAIAGLADRAGSGNPADNTTAPPVPDGQQQDDPTLTAPAPDAGAAVSEVAQPDPVVPAPVATPTPWAEAIDNPDGTITLKGDVPLIKQWAKESGVKAMPGKGGLLVAKSSAAKVREYATPAASEPVQQIEAARAEVAPEPTEAQKEAGNYKKGHLKLQGLDIALENPKGSTRSGTDKDGKAWQSTMAHDYGYIKRTLGADGDHVDVFIGDRPDSETVYVVDQVDPKTGKFDEHKVMMGFADEQAAQTGYLANYEKGWKGLGSIKAMPVEEFKRWVKDGDTTKPVGEQPAAGVDIGTLTDDEVMAVADELGISHDDNPDDARWGLEGAKKDALSTAIARVRNPSSTTPIKPAASNSNIVSAPPLQDEGGGAKRAVSFSKQAMAQGEKPAKHLTRKEAELVTKEWFKQYRGASGIDVQIHATQAELEQALGLAAKDGLIRRAAFDDDNGTLHVAADTIAHPKRMREILRHEVLAHYGLANVLGDGEYTKLISRIIKSKSAPSMKAVWDWVDTHYAGEDVGVQAEEVIAHLAELEQGAWRRGWDQVVAWITKALRTVGFVPGGITAAETRVLIEGLGKKMKRGGPDNGGPDGGHKFSQESEQPAKKGRLKMSQANTAADKAMEKLNLGPKPDIIDKTKANLDKLRKVDRGVVESWVDRFIKKANTEVLDALAPIKYAEDAAGITDAADSGYVAARMATGAASTMQATMLYGLPEWKDGVIQKKAGTGEKDALLGIFSDLGADLHNWLGWMAGHRAEMLMAQGRENLLSEQDIAALKGLGKGKEAKFMEAKARWNRLNAATLDLAQEAGLFTAEARAEFENEWYIPFFRESDDGDVIAPFKPKGIANQNAGIKKLKGGEANTNDLLENIFTSTSKLIDASMKNMAAQKTVWNLADTGLIEVVAKPNMMDWRALKNGKGLITVKLEGEDYMIRVDDPDLYRAMTFFDRQPFGAMVNVAAKAKRLLTAGVTASPEFMLRNFLRDSLSSWAISKDGFKPVIDSIKGVKKTLAMDGSTIDVMFSGASFLGGYVNGNDPSAMADTVRKSLRRKGMTPEQIARYEKSIIRNAAHAKGVVADAWEKYSRYGEALENANREAVYAAAIKAGKSHAQAAFESKDLMDFSMLGAARAIQGASLVLPFFNARLQGLGKLSRELRDNPREIAKRAGMITAMSLGLLAANWDDERYEELPDWDKDANWHFFVGDQHFRIPKPFEIGVMFGTIPERMVRAMGDKDTGAQFGKAVARAIGDTFALNPTPQIVKPLVEAAFNYDTFRGGPIDSPQDLAVKAEARYNEQTSLLMRELGELSGFSPKQLEHLVIGYTGTIGGYVMATADGLIRASRPGESASWRADEIPLVKAVYRGTGPAKSTQHMEEFYRMLSEVNQLKRTVDQYRSEGLDDKANELLEEQGGILKSRRSLSRTQQQVRVVRNKIELIQRDRSMNAEEKRKRIDELLARRNDLVYQAVNKNRENWE
ncbi:TPA: LPD38 domain-containing protein [Aeromonas veronii]